MFRFRQISAAAFAALLLSALPNAGYAASSMFNPIDVVGKGNATISEDNAACNAVGLICNTGDLCFCTQSTGSLAATPNDPNGFGGGTFTLTFLVDAVQNSPAAPPANDAGDQCFYSTGVVSMVSRDSKASKATFLGAGLACNANATGVYPALNALPLVFSDSVSVKSGTGNLASMMGVSNLSWDYTPNSANPLAGTTTFEVQGNLFPK
jgi:hypothetical protein